MPCSKCLNYILPWRRRRRKEVMGDTEQAEEIGLRQEEDFAVVTMNDTIDKGGFRYKGKYLGQNADDSSRGFHLLSVIMCSDEFERGDRTCIQLIKHIYQGNVEGLSDYLDTFTKYEIDSIEIGGQRLLHILCLKQDVESLTLVLALGVDVNAVNNDGVSALHLAVSERWAEGVETLLSYGANSNTPPKFKRYSPWPYNELPILTAARNGDYETTVLLLDQEPDLLCTDSNNNTILHLACQSHNPDLLSKLLENKLILNEISSSNNKGYSPLHMVMTGENLSKHEEEIFECTQMLLQKGANINHLTSARKTPLYFAAHSNLPSIVKFLLESGGDPKIRAIDGKTVLHAACRSGSHESLSLLLKSGRTSNLVLVEDNFGYAPFHIAVSSCSVICCEILIRNGDHLTRLDSLGRSRCSLVLSNMPSALLLLRRLFDANISVSDKNPDDPDFNIKMDFSVLLSKSSEDVEASLISDIGGSGMDSLLKHPLVETFLYLKWHRIRAFFYVYVLLYFLFLVVHTFYIVKTFDMKTDWNQEKSLLKMVHVIHVIMVLFLMIPGTITIFANIKKYFKQWETYCKVIALSTAGFVVFSRDTNFQEPDIQRNVAAVSIFFTWVEFMMLLGRFPSLGVYILMFTRVAKSIIRFLLAFSSLLIAFTLSFGILLKNIGVFKTFPIGFVKTLMMMLGEIDYNDIYESTKTESKLTIVMSHILLVVFLFLIPVLMANLLIGLAVNDLPDLQYHGKIRRLVKEASYLESYERLLLVFKEWTCIPSSVLNMFSGRGSIKREISIYPNQLHKYKVNSLIIPSDAIKEAIEIGTKENAERIEENMETTFRKFFNEYLNDRDRLEDAIHTLQNMMSSQNKDGGTDIPDGRYKSKRKPVSLKKRKSNTKHMLT